VATAQERIAPILALLTAAVTQRVPATTDASVKAWTVLAAIAVTSLIVGLVFYTLGRLRLGNLIRYIPYPVVGGFLAGSGWLLVLGAIRVTTHQSSGVADVPRLFAMDSLVRWLPAVVLGGLLFWSVRFRRQPRLFIAILAGALPVFYLAVAFSGSSVEGARMAGWLPGRTSSIGGLLPGLWSPGALTSARWDVMPQLAGIIGSVLVTSALSLLLNASGIELLTRAEADLNHELRTAGLANLTSGAAGGMIGFHSLNFTRLARDVGADGKLPALIAVAGCGGALAIGPGAATYVPAFVLGGLLCYLGLGFLHDWVIRARQRLPRSDYVVVLLILAVIGTLGYVEGVAFGLMAALILFVHKYSRISVVTHALTAREHPSNVDRPAQQRRLLADRGSEVLVLRLQGFIFFGTANSVLQQVRRRAETRDSSRLGFVVLDFRRVSGLDSSAAFSLSRCMQLAEKHGFQLVLTQLSDEIRRQLREDVFRTDEGPNHRILPNLDHGVEWCEERLLASASEAVPAAVERSRERQTVTWQQPAGLESFLGYMERQEVPAGTVLIREGSDADALYFLESGEVDTVLQTASGVQRLRRHGSGTVVGELGLFLGVPRTASVVTHTACVVYRLTANRLRQLQRDAPGQAAEFYHFMAHHLAERLVNSNRIIKAFMD
jgi:SulP family sulfate permease